MEDEKYDRAFSGLQGAGSTYICTLCHATEDSAMRNVGTFKIERTLEETRFLADYIKANPDNLNPKALANLAKGVKSAPILMSQPRERLLDATHADINMARFFKKVVIRLISGIKQWEETATVKPALNDAEAKFDRHIKKNIGSVAMLLMPGNYARMFFEEKNTEVITCLISDDDDRENFVSVLDKFRMMRAVYRASRPNQHEIVAYKTNALAFANLMKEKFPFAKWPNYFHKLVEHVQELLLDTNTLQTIGAMSGEGLEAGNKLFRHIRKNLSSKGNTYEGLVDVLSLHWLYSSPSLQRLSSISRQKYSCGHCGNTGHNRVTCPMFTQECE